MTLDHLMMTLAALRASATGDAEVMVSDVLDTSEELYDAPVTGAYVQAGHVFISIDGD